MEKSQRNKKRLELMPSEIRFTQDSVAMTFQDGNKLNATCEDIVKGTIRLYQFPSIHVLKMGDYYYSVDNRRLYIFRVLEKVGFLTKITVELISEHDRDITTKNDGCHVTVRQQKDNNDQWLRDKPYLHCPCKQQRRKAKKPEWWDQTRKCHKNQSSGFHLRTFFEASDDSDNEICFPKKNHPNYPLVQPQELPAVATFLWNKRPNIVPDAPSTERQNKQTTVPIDSENRRSPLFAQSSDRGYAKMNHKIPGFGGVKTRRRRRVKTSVYSPFNNTNSDDICHVTNQSFSDSSFTSKNDDVSPNQRLGVGYSPTNATNYFRWLIFILVCFIAAFLLQNLAQESKKMAANKRWTF